MTRYAPERALIIATEAILARAWGGPVRLGTWDELVYNKAYRFHILQAPNHGSSPAPTTVILKKARPKPDQPYDPDATTWNPAWRFLADWTGTEFLSTLPTSTPHSPRFLGGDRDVGVFVMDDLGRRESLLTRLMGDNPAAAEQALLWHAEALGRLHADTMGQQDGYHRIRDALGPRVVQSDAQAWCDLGTARDALHAGFRTIGVVPAPGFDGEYRHLTHAIVDPGPFAAYTHCDPCPDNNLIVGERIQLLDFERSGYHHALLDAVYGRLCFPSCGYANRLPARLALRMEAAYRAQIVETCPQAADDVRFGQEIVHACVYWIISNGNWLLASAYKDDYQWGLATWRQRVLLRLGLVVQATESLHHLPAMGETARLCLQRLRQIWPVAVQTMPLYPTFRDQEAEPASA